MGKTTDMGMGVYTIGRFAADMKERLENICGAGYDIIIREAKKNNGVTLTGISIMRDGEEGAAVPLIYLEDFFGRYCSGTGMGELSKEIYAQHRQHSGALFAIKDLSSFDKVRGRICHMLVNAGMNREKLETLPHRLFMDLAIVYYIPVEPEGKATVTVTDDLMRSWGVDEETLFREAGNNTRWLMDYRIMSMQEAINQLLKEELPDAGFTPEIAIGPAMYIASSRSRVRGASCLLDGALLDSFARKNGGSYYILPSSIHELIFVPVQEGCDREDLGEIVRTVNMNELAREDVLSDHAYFYHANTGEIEIIG